MPIFRITDPESGKILRVTGDTAPTEQELEQLFVSQRPEATPQQEVKAPQDDPGFISNLATDFQKRGEEFGKSIFKVKQDIEEAGFNPVDAALALSKGQRRVAGAVAGGAGDIIGEGVSAAAGAVADIIPEGIKQPVKDAANSLIESSFGKVVADAIKGGAESFSEFEKKDPELAQDVKDIFNVGLLVAPVKLKGKIPKVVETTEQITKKAADEKILKKALEKGDVLTTDVIPPKTFVGKSVQKITERIPLIGTGGKRKAQQETRVKSLEDIAKEFDIDPSSSFEKDIIDSANNIFKKSQKRAAQLRSEAVEELNKVGDVSPKKAIDEINSQIKKIKDQGLRGDKTLLGTLQSIKTELKGNFERMIDQRTTIFNDISDIGSAKSPIKSGGDAVLTKIAGKLSQDMDDFAKQAGLKAGANRDLAKASGKWKASNRIFKDNFAKAKDTELKRALTKGKVQPEVINSTIKGGKLSELNRLHGNIGPDGRKAVKQQILKSALEKANGNPTIFLNELNRMNNKKAIEVFFRGNEKLELDGLKKFLDMTRRAQEASASIATQQEVTAVALGAGAVLATAPTIGVASGIGILGRAYESKVVRNLLLKLSRLPSGSNKAKELIGKITPLVAISAQTARPESNE
jgi:hypothetical protein